MSELIHKIKDLVDEHRVHDKDILVLAQAVNDEGIEGMSIQSWGDPVGFSELIAQAMVKDEHIRIAVFKAIEGIVKLYSKKT